MAGETQLWLRRLVQAVGIGLVAAAVVVERTRLGAPLRNR